MLKSGEIIGNEYQIIEPIGKGGISVVYKARHLNLQKDVVLKRVKDEQLPKIRNLREEAQILSRLKHQYLPQVYNFLETREGVFTVIDFIPGQPLSYYIKQGYKIDQKQLIVWGIQLCEALDYLHTRKPPIIHSDIKPDNIMVTPEGQICLIDFNISLDGKSKNYISGQSAGYASPEQYFNVAPERDEQGNPSYRFQMQAALDERSDIYSLGASYYHLLTGIRPGNLGKGEQIVPLSAFSLPYSEAFLQIITRMMAPDPNDRYQTAASLKKAFQDVWKQDRRYIRLRHTRQVAVVCLSALFAVSAAAVVLSFRQMGIDADNEYLQTVAQANEARQNGDMDEALALYDEAISMDASEVEAYYQKMLLYAEEGDYQACNFFGQQLLTSEVLADTLAVNPQEKADICYLMATGCFEQEDYVTAAQYYEETLELNGDNPLYYRDYAITLARMMQIDQAESVLDEAVNAGLDTESVKMVEGEIELAQGDWQPAAEKFQEICYAYTDDDVKRRAYLLWARALKTGGMITEAAEVLEEGSGVLSGNNGAMLKRQLGQFYLQAAAQNPEQQQEYAQKAVDVLQEQVESGIYEDAAVYNLASALELLGEYDQADAYLAQLSESKPEDYLPYVRRALLEINRQSTLANEERDYTFVQEQYEKAAALYEKATTNGLSDPDMKMLENAMQQLVAGGWLE